MMYNYLANRVTGQKPVAKLNTLMYSTVIPAGVMSVTRLAPVTGSSQRDFFISGIQRMACKVVSTKMIESELDILELDIVDFNRLNNHFDNPRQALECATSWIKGLARVTVVEVDDFWTVPTRDDFPGWDHVGQHPRVGRQYWNWFYHHHPKGELFLSDSPDLCGILEDGALIFGDFGKVSASTFIMALKRMNRSDIWVSIPLDGERQVIIEYLVKMRGFSKPIIKPRREVKQIIPKHYRQLGLFGS